MKTTTSVHRHRAVPKLQKIRGFGGPVSKDENRRAHGNVCVVDTCCCGAQRLSNHNQGSVERGEWTPARSSAELPRPRESEVREEERP